MAAQVPPAWGRPTWEQEREAEQGEEPWAPSAITCLRQSSLLALSGSRGRRFGCHLRQPIMWGADLETILGNILEGLVLRGAV